MNGLKDFSKIKKAIDSFASKIVDPNQHGQAAATQPRHDHDTLIAALPMQRD